MTLRYKVGDVVVLAENVQQNWNRTFVPGVAVKINQLCDHNSNDEHYAVSLVSDPSDYWYIVDKEISHEITALLQKTNETAYIVGKTEAVSDDNAEKVRTPVLQENAPQTSNQKPSFVAFFTSVIVAKNKAVSDIGEFLYDENSTKISLEDEGGGAFLIVEQDYNGAIQQIRLDINEVDAVFSAIKQLVKQLEGK